MADQNGVSQRERDAVLEAGVFDAAFYLETYPDVAIAGIDPLEHYLAHGRFEKRKASATFDPEAYLEANPEVAASGIEPFLHYVLIGRARNAARFRAIGTKPSEYVVLECMAGAAFLDRYGFTLETDSSLDHAARAISELALRTRGFPIDTQSPDVSIIIPVCGQLQVLLNCLDSLVTQVSAYRVEIVVVDDASPPESRIQEIAGIPWVRYVRRDHSSGFAVSCNEGASFARGRYLVFLNSDTRLVCNWLDELIGSFNIFPKAALIGSRLIDDDHSGKGHTVWRPEHCHARQVECFDTAPFAVSTEVWKHVGGFDTTREPTHCGNTDLGFRLRRKGYETWLQPLSLAIHCRERNVSTPDQSPIGEANQTRRRRILIIDAQTPTPDRDSGSNNTYEVVRLFLHLGWHVSFLPRDFMFAGEYTANLQRMGVEVLIEPFVSELADVFETKPGCYDVIFAFRYTSLSDWYGHLRKNFPAAHIVFHDVDLHYLRIQRQADLLCDSSLQVEAKAIQDRELELFAASDCSVVVTDVEKTIIESQLPVRNIVVYPYTIDIRRSQRSYDRRFHLCFLGNHAHDPNPDAVLHFVNEIWPRVKPRLEPNAKFLIIGPNAPDKLLKLASEDVIVTGHAPRLDDLLDDCRMSVAPLRYGAGIKGKLVRALASGLPSVASSLAVEGMGLVAGQHVLVADDPHTFAEAIVRLYHRPDLWHQVQEAGYAFVEAHYSWKRGLETCSRILQTAHETWATRNGQPNGQLLT